ncbi:MAG: hypothetical protein FWD01_05035 [Defluviitaleaceae bacterium]|nr:hypothetical protein [Defluviitaleaceae bacterium]
MVSITEVSIISIDKSGESWAIEGEAIFDGDVSTTFGATYYPLDEELENVEFEIVPENFDRPALIQMIIDSALEYDE